MFLHLGESFHLFLLLDGSVIFHQPDCNRTSSGLYDHTWHGMPLHLACFVTTLNMLYHHAELVPSWCIVYHTTTQGPIFAYFAVTMISLTRLYWCLFWHGMPLFLACYVAKLHWPHVLPSCYTTLHHTRSCKVTFLEGKRKPGEVNKDSYCHP